MTGYRPTTRTSAEPEGPTMPKQKNHKGARDRFKVTRNGKVLHRSQNRNHLMETKTASRKRRLARDSELHGADAKQIKRLLGER